MRNILLISFVLTVLFTQAQTNRFRSAVFESTSVKYNVIYGKAKTQAGRSIELKMDIYQPVDDTMKSRPLIILAHGGYFFFGDKANFTIECEELAKAGYVAASINYRLIDVEDDSFYVSKYAVIDAVADMKAAVRYSTKNLYKVDTTNIFIGGYSAGAIASLHYAYANTPNDVLLMGGQKLLEYVHFNGGINGNSGNPGYSSKIRGVINIAGALFNAKLVDKDEPCLFSIHGTADDIVPYNEGLVGTTKIVTQGSGLIHKRAEKIGLTNKLITLKDEDHFGYLDCEPCLEELMAFLYQNMQK